jgi:hypothetical protein
MAVATSTGSGLAIMLQKKRSFNQTPFRSIVFFMIVSFGGLFSYELRMEKTGNTMQLLLIDSSIFQQWGDTGEAFPGACIQNCAIGGTTTDFWVSSIQETLQNTQSDLVAYYCGSNDFNQNVPESRIIDNTLQIFDEVKRAQRVFVYYTIIKITSLVLKII